MHYEAVVLDLDGVVYIGAEAVPFAIESLNALRETTLTAATNNASRPSALVATHLQALGLRIDERCIMTSAQAAAQHLSQLLPEASMVLAVGGDGVADALTARGFRPLRASEDLAQSSEVADLAAAVLIGYGPRVAWFDLAAAHWAIQRGKPWIATNTDLTVPLPFGSAPGNGAMVGLLRNSTGTTPTVVGKPKPALFDALAEQVGSRNLLVIGDRLDTDIDGALAAGMDSLLVLTGVHGLPDLVSRPTDAWPTYIAHDLRSLHAEPARVWVDGDHLRTDSDHPLVAAVARAALGLESGAPTFGPSPLIDVRGVRSARPAQASVAATVSR